jgi:hypothetical protein
VATTGSAGQAARLRRRLADRQAIKALEDERAADLEPPAAPFGGKFRGAVDGSLFDWESTLYLDPDTQGVWDGGDQEARDIREALKADWKMRQLALVLTSPLKGATWKLIPGKGDSGEAEDCEEKLRRAANSGGMSTPIQRVISQAAYSIVYKRAFFAKGWKLDPVKGDGSVMFSQLAARPATTCRLSRDPVTGAFRGFEQDIVLDQARDDRHRDGKPVKFTPKQSLVFINGLDQDPVGGVSDLEVAMWCWQTKRKVMLLWLTFLSAYSLPRTMVWSRGGDETKAKQAAQMIASLAGGGVGYADGQNLTLETLGSGGGTAPSSGPFMEMVKYLDSAGAGSVLAGFTDLTSAASDGRGSYALSKDSTDMFSQTRTHAANGLEETLTNHALADMVRYNYGPPGIVPTFKFDALAGVDEGPLMALLQALATTQASALPTEFINELALHAARLLDLDVDKIKTALERHAADLAQQAAAAGAPPAAAAAAGVDGAVRTVRRIAATVAR